MFSPRSVLGAAVDVSPVPQQDLDDLRPSPGRRLVEGRVAGVVTAIDLSDVLLQTVKDDILRGRTGGTAVRAR